MKRTMFAVIAVLMVLSLVLTGCQQEEETLKIGILVPLSGEVKTFGESTRNGAMLAFEAAIADGLDIEIVVADSKCDAQEGANAANKLIFEDGVSMILGPVCSGAAIPVSEIAQANDVLMLTATATNPSVTINEDGSNKDMIFRACFLDPFQGTVVAKLAIDDLGAQTCAILYDMGDDYVKGLAEYIQSSFTDLGGEVLVYEAYTSTDTDFSAILGKVAAADPDVIFIPDYYDKVNLIAAQLVEKGIEKPLIGCDGWDSAELNTELISEGYFSNHYSPADERAIVQDFIANYEAAYGTQPDALATLGYDAANMLIQAIKEADSTDATAIRDALAAEEFEGVSGNITFDANGDPIKSAAVVQIQDGVISFYKFVAP